MNPYLLERTIHFVWIHIFIRDVQKILFGIIHSFIFVIYSIPFSHGSENFIQNHSLVHFCDIFHSLQSWNISDNPLYFVIQRFASHDKIQWIIAGNDVNIFVSSVFNGEYYMKSNTKTGTRYFSQKQTMYKSSPFHGSKGHTGNLGPQSLKVGGQIV